MGARAARLRAALRKLGEPGASLKKWRKFEESLLPLTPNLKILVRKAKKHVLQ